MRSFPGVLEEGVVFKFGLDKGGVFSRCFLRGISYKIIRRGSIMMG